MTHAQGKAAAPADRDASGIMACFVGRPYVEMNCYDLVREGAARILHVRLPTTAAECLCAAAPLADALPPVTIPIAGDVVELDGPRGGDEETHLALVVSPQWCMHATRIGGVQMIGVEVLRRSKGFRRILRLRRMGAVG